MKKRNEQLNQPQAEERRPVRSTGKGQESASDFALHLAAMFRAELGEEEDQLDPLLNWELPASEEDFRNAEAAPEDESDLFRAVADFLEEETGQKAPARVGSDSARSDRKQHREARSEPEQSRKRREEPEQSRKRREEPEQSRKHREEPEQSRKRREEPEQSRKRREEPEQSRKRREEPERARQTAPGEAPAESAAPASERVVFFEPKQKKTSFFDTLRDPERAAPPAPPAEERPAKSAAESSPAPDGREAAPRGGREADSRAEPHERQSPRRSREAPERRQTRADRSRRQASDGRETRAKRQPEPASRETRAGRQPEPASRETRAGRQPEPASRETRAGRQPEPASRETRAGRQPEPTARHRDRSDLFREITLPASLFQQVSEPEKEAEPLVLPGFDDTPFRPPQEDPSLEELFAPLGLKAAPPDPDTAAVLTPRVREREASAEPQGCIRDSSSSEIRDQGSEIRDQGSGIKDQRSEIKDQGSESVAAHSLRHDAPLNDHEPAVGGGVPDAPLPDTEPTVGGGVPDAPLPDSEIRDQGSEIKDQRSESVAAHSVRHDAPLNDHEPTVGGGVPDAPLPDSEIRDQGSEIKDQRSESVAAHSVRHDAPLNDHEPTVGGGVPDAPLNDTDSACRGGSYPQGEPPAPPAAAAAGAFGALLIEMEKSDPSAPLRFAQDDTPGSDSAPDAPLNDHEPAAAAPDDRGPEPPAPRRTKKQSWLQKLFSGEKRHREAARQDPPPQAPAAPASKPNSLPEARSGSPRIILVPSDSFDEAEVLASMEREIPGLSSLLESSGPKPEPLPEPSVSEPEFPELTLSEAEFPELSPAESQLPKPAEAEPPEAPLVLAAPISAAPAEETPEAPLTHAGQLPEAAEPLPAPVFTVPEAIFSDLPRQRAEAAPEEPLTHSVEAPAPESEAPAALRIQFEEHAPEPPVREEPPEWISQVYVPEEATEAPPQSPADSPAPTDRSPAEPEEAWSDDRLFSAIDALLEQPLFGAPPSADQDEEASAEAESVPYSPSPDDIAASVDPVFGSASAPQSADRPEASASRRRGRDTLSVPELFSLFGLRRDPPDQAPDLGQQEADTAAAPLPDTEPAVGGGVPDAPLNNHEPTVGGGVPDAPLNDAEAPAPALSLSFEDLDPTPEPPVEENPVPELWDPLSLFSEAEEEPPQLTPLSRNTTGTLPSLEELFGPTPEAKPKAEQPAARPRREQPAKAPRREKKPSWLQRLFGAVSGKAAGGRQQTALSDQGSEIKDQRSESVAAHSVRHDAPLNDHEPTVGGGVPDAPLFDAGTPAPDAPLNDPEPPVGGGVPDAPLTDAEKTDPSAPLRSAQDDSPVSDSVPDAPLPDTEPIVGGGVPDAPLPDTEPIVGGGVPDAPLPDTEPTVGGGVPDAPLNDHEPTVGGGVPDAPLSDAEETDPSAPLRSAQDDIPGSDSVPDAPLFDAGTPAPETAPLRLGMEGFLASLGLREPEDRPAGADEAPEAPPPSENSPPDSESAAEDWDPLALFGGAEDDSKLPTWEEYLRSRREASAPKPEEAPDPEPPVGGGVPDAPLSDAEETDPSAPLRSAQDDIPGSDSVHDAPLPDAGPPFGSADNLSAFPDAPLNDAEALDLIFPPEDGPSVPEPPLTGGASEIDPDPPLEALFGPVPEAAPEPEALTVPMDLAEPEPAAEESIAPKKPRGQRKREREALSLKDFLAAAVPMEEAKPPRPEPRKQRAALRNAGADTISTARENPEGLILTWTEPEEAPRTDAPPPAAPRPEPKLPGRNGDPVPSADVRREEPPRKAAKPGAPHRKEPTPEPTQPPEEKSPLHPEEAYRVYARPLDEIGSRLVLTGLFTLLSLFFTLYMTQHWSFLPEIFSGGTTVYILLGLLGLMVLVNRKLYFREWRDEYGLRAELLLGLATLFTALDCFPAAQELRPPFPVVIGALLMVALWGRYDRGLALLSTVKVLREEPLSAGVSEVQDITKGSRGLIRTKPDVDSFMSKLETRDLTQRVLRIYTPAAAIAGLLLTLLISIGLRKPPLWTGALIFLGSVPVTGLLAFSRLFCLLARRLSGAQAALCGYHGAEVFGGEHSILIGDDDVFPAGSLTLNGFKVYNGNPDRMIAYAAAAFRSSGSALDPVFEDLLVTHNGRHYTVDNFRFYDSGGIGASIMQDVVLLGSLDFMRRMGVHMDKGARVKQAVYMSLNGELAAVFAVRYTPPENLRRGLAAIAGNRHFKGILVTRTFLGTPGFLKVKFGIPTGAFHYPSTKERIRLSEAEMKKSGAQGAILAKDSFSGFAQAAAGGRLLRSATLGAAILTVLGGLIGLVLMGVLAALHADETATALNLLLYAAAWLAPTLLLTAWARHF